MIHTRDTKALDLSSIKVGCYKFKPFQGMHTRPRLRLVKSHLMSLRASTRLAVSLRDHLLPQASQREAALVGGGIESDEASPRRHCIPKGKGSNHRLLQFGGTAFPKGKGSNHHLASSDESLIMEAPVLGARHRVVSPVTQRVTEE